MIISIFFNLSILSLYYCINNINYSFVILLSSNYSIVFSYYSDLLLHIILCNVVAILFPYLSFTLDAAIAVGVNTITDKCSSFTNFRTLISNIDFPEPAGPFIIID